MNNIEKNHTLQIVPIKRKDAQDFVEKYHRHLGKVVGAVFQLACAKYSQEYPDGKICGVVLVGRPIARYLDNGWTLEVNRCATDGTKNAASKLYAASWRVTRALGYQKLITYTRKSESGSSLRGAGWKTVAETQKSDWNTKNRPRYTPEGEYEPKLRWEITNAIK